MKDDYYANILGDLNGLDKELFERALDHWTERPQLGNGYNKRALKLYDALIWTRVENTRDRLNRTKNLIRERNEAGNDSRLTKLLTPATSDDLLTIYDEISNDINNWKYTGKIYRVINCKKSQIEYHQLIASWVNDPEAFKRFNNLYKKHNYSFLVGNTGRDWAFDVNKYRRYIDNEHPYTEHELEIIFPMNEKRVVDVFYGTLEEFYERIEMRG